MAKSLSDLSTQCTNSTGNDSRPNFLGKVRDGAQLVSPLDDAEDFDCRSQSEDEFAL